jgi:hypothetical protein
LFNTGDVLTAAQVNTYLNEQTVMVFASSAARTSALSGVLAEGMVSYLQDTNAVEVYNGTAWVGVSGAGDVTEVQAGTGISVASGTGPIPVVTNTMATAVDAKGDLIVGTGADTFARLAVGTNGHTLVADSSETTGLKWAAPAGGGKVLQVVQALTTGYIAITSTNTFSDANLSASITPSSASSKVLIIIHQMLTAYTNSAAAPNDGFMRILRGATAIWNDSSTQPIYQQQSVAGGGPSLVLSMCYLDSPATTSSTTYKPQYKQTTNANDHTLYMNYGGNQSTITLMEIGA